MGGKKFENRKIGEPTLCVYCSGPGKFQCEIGWANEQHQTFPTGLNHHGTVPPPLTVGSVMVNDQYYSITNDRLQARRDKTSDEDYFVLTLAAIANELQAAFPGGTEYICDVGLALGLLLST